MLQYIAYIAIYCIYCNNKQYIDIFIKCIVLYCSNEYCNISIYCNIVTSLIYTYTVKHLIHLLAIVVVVLPLQDVQNRCLTQLL